MKQALTIATFIMILIGSGCRENRVIPSPDNLTANSQDSVSSPQTSDQPTPFSSEIENDLQDLLETRVTQEKLPGLVMYIATSTGVWADAAGKVNRDADLALKPTDRFRIGTLTHLFTTVVCLQLAEEGQLDLDLPIAHYLPPEVSDRVSNSSKITVRQLLGHRSSLADSYTDEFQQAVRANPNRQWAAKEILEYAYNLEPANIRGGFSPANTNYLLLELIVEGITGKPFAEVIHQRIRTPAALTNTFTELREPIPGGFAQGYQDWNGDDTAENITQPLLNDGLGLADKGIVSNAPDLVRFVQILFLGDKLLYSPSLDQMLDTIPVGMGDEYGLGIMHIETQWGEAWGNTGSALGFQSMILYLPVHDLTIVVWTNTGDYQSESLLPIAQEALSTILGEPDFRW